MSPCIIQQSEASFSLEEPSTKKEETSKMVNPPTSQEDELSGNQQTSQPTSPNLKPNFRGKSKPKKEVDAFTERRNIIPNNINHILSFIQRKSKSEPIVEKIMRNLKGST